MAKFVALLAAALLLTAGCMPVSLAQSAEENPVAAAQATVPAKLWIDMSMGPQLLDWYNGVAQPPTSPAPTM